MFLEIVTPEAILFSSEVDSIFVPGSQWRVSNAE